MQNDVDLLLAEKKQEQQAHARIVSSLEQKEKEFESLKIETYKLSNKMKKVEEENEELQLRIKIMQIDNRVNEMELSMQHKQSNDELQNNLNALHEQLESAKTEYEELHQKHQRDQQLRLEEEDEKTERQLILEEQLKQEREAHSATQQKCTRLEDKMGDVANDLKKIGQSYQSRVNLV